MDTKSKNGSRLRAAGLVLALGALMGAPGAATAGSKHCASYDEVMQLLSEKYAEAPIARGLSLDGRMVEILADKDGGSWSIVVSRPDRSSCIALAGEGWRSLAVGKARMVKGP